MADESSGSQGKIDPVKAMGEGEVAGPPMLVLPTEYQRSIAVNGIFIILCIGVLYFAAEMLKPVTVALLLSLLLSPAVRFGQRYRIPSEATAAIIVLGIVILIVAAIYGLSGSARDWMDRVPRNFFRIEQLIESIREPLEKMKDATEQVEKATKADGGETVKVQMDQPGLAERFLSGTPQVLASLGVVVLLLYFLLASGDTFLRKTVSMFARFEDKKRVVEITRSIQKDVSYYLGMLTLLYIGLSAVVGLTCWAIGLENPILWGVVTFFLSYAPFLGTVIISLILAFVGLLSVSDPAIALLPVIVYLVCVFSVENILVPFFLGHHLALSPVAIFLSIIFWGFIWGVVGALVAVPILAIIKIVCDRVESLKPIAEYLSP